MKRKNAILEGAVSSGLLVLLIFITFYTPMVSLLTIWFFPLPLIYCTGKYGWRMGLLPLFIALLVPFILIDPAYGMVTAFFICLGYAMGVVIHLKKSAFAVLLAGSLVNIAVLIIYLAISILIFRFNPIEFFQTALSQSMESTLNQMGALLNGQSDELMEAYNAQIDYLGYLAPGIIVTVGVFYAFIVALIQLPILRLLKINAPKWIPLRLWQVPKSVIWIYLLILALQLFGSPQPGSSLFIAVINILFLLEILLAIQGFSFIFYFAHVKNMPIALPIIITVVAVVFNYLLHLIRILGIIDLGFNLRARLTKKKK